tara:strand:+ start:5921 stop:6136 length:216 start_codon:yes stop_codon:yes gene_type:complete
MSENTTITSKRLPNPQKVRWYNVAYYDNFQQADEHRKNLDGLTKVRRCGPDKTMFVVKSGTPIPTKESKNE